MPRVKLSDDEFDVEELDVEWTEGDYVDYDGEIPATGTILWGRCTKAWWTESQNGNSMIKALIIAEDNDGELGEFDGLPTWDNITFVPSAAFRYGPFLQAMGISLKDIKAGLYLAEEDDNIGSPIEKVKGKSGEWVPGSEDAVVHFVVKRDRYNGVWQSKVSRYLSADDREPEEEEPEEEAEEAPRSRRSSTRKASTRTPARTRSRRAEPEEEPEDEEPEEEEERPARRSSRRAPARGRSRSAPAKRRGRRSDDDGDEPPF